MIFLTKKLHFRSVYSPRYYPRHFVLFSLQIELFTSSCEHCQTRQRAELKSLIESIEEKYGPGQPGFLGSLRYKVLDNPNLLVEIADWASAQMRAAAMQKAMTTGAYAPLEDLLDAPFRATIIRQLS